MPLGLPLSSYGLMQNPEPFVWGRGGGRRSLDDISLERRLAQQQMLSGADYSPVQHWTQGLARVGNGLAGGLRMRSADREAEEARTAQQQIIAELIGGGGENPDASIAAALADPDMRDVALNVLESRQTKPVEPEIMRANNGDIVGINPMTGEVLFTRPDPNPKPVVDWITADNPDGTKTLVPVGPNGPITGGGVQGAPTAPVGRLTPIDGGPAPQAPGNFSAGFRGLPGETVTSTFRDPARNRLVGGVANSFHMRRDAQGNAMARDSVPPPGMSMVEYYRKLKAENPHLQVINEGDHVHMEPR